MTLSNLLSLGACKNRLNKIKRRISLRLAKDFRKAAISTIIERPQPHLKRQVIKYFCGRIRNTQYSPLSPATRRAVLPFPGVSSEDKHEYSIDDEFFKECVTAILLENPSSELVGRALNISREIIKGTDPEDFKHEDTELVARLAMNPKLFSMHYTYIIYIYFCVCSIVLLLEKSLVNWRDVLLAELTILKENTSFAFQTGQQNYLQTIRKINSEIHILYLKSSRIFPIVEQKYLELSTVEDKLLSELQIFNEIPESKHIVNSEVFREIVCSATSVLFYITLPWNAFKKWNVWYFFCEQGCRLVMCQSPENELRIKPLADFISILDVNETNIPHLHEVTFSMYLPLYKHCLPRPFRDLKKFWTDATEEIQILNQKHSLTIFDYRRETLLIQIFGVSLICVDEKVVKKSVFKPKQGFYLPSGIACHIIPQSWCCYKQYQWIYTHEHSTWNGDICPPSWIIKSDFFSRQLIQKSVMTKHSSNSITPNPNDASTVAAPTKTYKFSPKKHNPPMVKRNGKRLPKRHKKLKFSRRRVTQTKATPSPKNVSTPFRKYSTWFRRREILIRRRELSANFRKQKSSKLKISLLRNKSDQSRVIGSRACLVRVHKKSRRQEFRKH